MKKHIIENGIKYELRGEQYYPVFLLSDQQEIGRFGRQHLAYLKTHRKGTYTTLLTTGKLNDYLTEIDREATELYHSLISKLAKSEGITEQLKAANPLRWVQEMNNIAQRASEIVLYEIIYR